MVIRYGYEITLTCQQPTALVCLLSVHEDRAVDIRVPETSFTNPDVPVSTYRDLFGNHCRRLVAPAGDLTMWGDATIEDDGRPDRVAPNARELPVSDLPDDSLVYLLGSRYCETDKLSQLARDIFGTVAPGWSRVQAICDFVHNHIRFDYMQARSTRTAFEVYHERVGVCRDFAHLAVAFCRCLNIPTRYVNGHLGDIGVPVVDPMDFSAWIEVFLDGEWFTFDPRTAPIIRPLVQKGQSIAETGDFSNEMISVPHEDRVPKFRTIHRFLLLRLGGTRGAARRRCQPCKASGCAARLTEFTRQCLDLSPCSLRRNPSVERVSARPQRRSVPSGAGARDFQLGEPFYGLPCRGDPTRVRGIADLDGGRETLVVHHHFLRFLTRSFEQATAAARLGDGQEMRWFPSGFSSRGVARERHMSRGGLRAITMETIVGWPRRKRVGA